MFLFHQFSPDLACAGGEKQCFPGFIRQIDMGVIEAETFLGQVHHRLQQLIRVQHGGSGGTAHVATVSSSSARRAMVSWACLALGEITG